MKRIQIQRELCDGCLNCTVACMAEHNPTGARDVESLDFAAAINESRNSIRLDAEGLPAPIFCRHCDRPECALACISGAMAKDPGTGRVTYDADRCAACFMCVLSCPFGVLKPDRSARRIIVKCDFCGDRELPRCVESCPKKAITLIEVE